MKKCNSNHLEKKENGMVFVAGIAHRPKGTAEGIGPQILEGISEPLHSHSLSILL